MHREERRRNGICALSRGGALRVACPPSQIALCRDKALRVLLVGSAARLRRGEGFSNCLVPGRSQEVRRLREVVEKVDVSDELSMIPTLLFSDGKLAGRWIV